MAIPSMPRFLAELCAVDTVADALEQCRKYPDVRALLMRACDEVVGLRRAGTAPDDDDVWTTASGRKLAEEEVHEDKDDGAISLDTHRPRAQQGDRTRAPMSLEGSGESRATAHEEGAASAASRGRRQPSKDPKLGGWGGVIASCRFKYFEVHR